MTQELMDYCKRHFIITREVVPSVFDAESKTITADLDYQYNEGGYIWILGTDLNDGLYELTEVADGCLTVKETIKDEVAGYTNIMKSKPPKSFVALADDIAEWVAKYGAGQAGVESERIDDYSVSYNADVARGGWVGAFAGRIEQFMSIYNDLPGVQ